LEKEISQIPLPGETTVEAHALLKNFGGWALTLDFGWGTCYKVLGSSL